jgi:high affinity sulfate transporter 1
VTSAGTPPQSAAPDDGDEAAEPYRFRVLGLSWRREYAPSWLRWDVVAGLTLAAYFLPSGLAYSSIANLPPQAGLYSCLCAGLVFWLFCSARQTAVAPTSAIAILVGASLGPLAGGDATRFGAFAAATALLVAAMCVVAWAVRAGAVANFISETVLTGFKTGLALYLTSTQLPKLLGIKGGSGSFWSKSWTIATHLSDVNEKSLLIGGAALVLLILGKLFLSKLPVPLFVLVAAIVAADTLDLGNHGVSLLGALPQGLPPVAVPAVSWDELDELLPLAMACFLLAAVETTAIGRMYESKSKNKVDVNRDLLAIGASNVAVGFGGGFPVSGGMSQSLVNETAGAKSPVSTLVASAAVLVVMVFFSGRLADLPQPALAAIVLVTVAGLFKFAAMKHLWRTARVEFVVAFAAMLGLLCFGLLRGVMLGVLLSILFLLIRASRPRVAFLGRIPGIRRFDDLARHETNVPVPGAVIFRPQVSLLYFNAANVRDRVMHRIRSTTPRPRLVVCDLSACPIVDTAGASMLASLSDELASDGMRLQIVETLPAVRDSLRLQGLEDKVGRIDRFTSVADAVDAFESERADAAGAA